MGVNGKTAVVFSAGMMFGAYQAGVWKALAGVLRPDAVVGVSSGALNAWAVAGGCGPDALREMWLNDEIAAVTMLRAPLPPWNGIFDSRRLEGLARGVYDSFRPRTEIGIVATRVRNLQRRLFRGSEITWRHLVASCAVPFGFRPVRIDGSLYTDGGMLGALPLWAASEMGATRIVAVLAMPRLPLALGRAFLKVVRAAAPRTPQVRTDVRVDIIQPSEPMGSLRDLILWRRENAERWIALGLQDGAEALRRLL
jgi:NTE family protein